MKYITKKGHSLVSEGVKSTVKSWYQRAKKSIVGTPETDASLTKKDQVANLMRRGMSKSDAMNRVRSST